MKLKQVEALCKDTGGISIFEGSDCQWLSNGYAAYAVYNLPKLTKDVIFTLFDIPKDKQNGFRITENDSLLEGLNFDDVDKYETPLKYVGRQFADGKKTLLPLQGSLGLIVIDTKFLKPFSGMSEGYELCERIDDKGKPYVAVKAGLMLLGVIMPYQIVNKEFIEELELLTQLAAMTLQNSKATGNAYKYDNVG